MEHTVPKNKRRRGGMADVRVRRSREDLRTALLDLLNAKTFDDITVREIAAHANVGYTTFFRHYPSKDALLDDLAAKEIGRLTAHVLPIYDSKDPVGACLAMCAYVQAQRPLWSALLTGGAASIVREELLKRSREATSTQPESGSLPPELGSALAVAVIVELLSWWLRQPQPWPADRVAEVLYRTAIAPFLSRS